MLAAIVTDWRVDLIKAHPGLFGSYSVPRRLRERILRALFGRKSVPLGELERSVRSVGDPSNAVMSLVCADVLELDLTTRPIQLTTIVRAR